MYPVKNAKAAIAVAKGICDEKPNQAGGWRAFERIGGDTWVATEQLPGGTSHCVIVPKTGPFPAEILTCRLLPVLRPQTQDRSLSPLYQCSNPLPQPQNAD